MEIIEKAPHELRIYENNPRKNDHAVGKVAESIRQFGFKVPVVIDRGGTIVCGHTRVKAAERLGLDTVPCVVADDLTDEQVKAFRLADNKVAELSEWDTVLLERELFDISDINMAEFGFDLAELPDGSDFFESRKRNDTDRQEDNEEYNEFLDKFELKKTTDDCYTPDNIYDEIAGWVASEYDVERKDFVRPFYPGGDYKKTKYAKTDIVVDNPPFSILSEIITFYGNKEIKYFLFAPAMTCFSNAATSKGTVITANIDIAYENGAKVPTAFCTNLEPYDIVARTAPELEKKVTEVNKANEKAQKANLPKYDYPDQVITAAMMHRWNHYGIDFVLHRSDCVKVDGLDSQKEQGKGIFGKGFLLAERAAAERAAAERAAAERAAAERAAATKWQLSEREWEIVRSLGK